MAQYKHDRFFKFYVQALYKTKGETRKNIQVRNDEDLEIDCMFVTQSDKFGWKQEDLGLFDREKNDIIKTSLKYCVYLRGLPKESLTEEEQEFMRTMEQVDAWLEAEIAEAEQKAKQENQQEIALRMLQENIPLDVIARITQLKIEQLQSLRSQLENN